MSSTTIPVKRPGLWVGPAFFLALGLIVLTDAPEVGTRTFYAVFSLASGYWLFRTTHIRVELGDEALRVFGQARTRRIEWKNIKEASAGPMRTMSPLARRFPYVALQVELATGEVRQFEEVSASMQDRAVVDSIVDAINGRLAT